jgi:uncharacterized protein YodC (DUF2158 family)
VGGKILLSLRSEPENNKAMFEKCFWQYKVRHHSVNDFAVGEMVFLKSNPEVPLIVCGFKYGQVCVTWFDDNGSRSEHYFVPEVILQYRFRGLQESHDERFIISLN